MHLYHSPTHHITTKPADMVKLEEVQDEEFAREQSGPTEGEDDWEDDSGTLPHHISSSHQHTYLPTIHD